MKYLNPEFFTSLPKLLGMMMRSCKCNSGKTILLSLTTLISVPTALLTAIYLSEFPESRLKDLIRLLNDYIHGHAKHSCRSLCLHAHCDKIWIFIFNWAFVLSILAVSMMIKTMEEALKLIPEDVRGNGLSLEIGHWRVVTSIVIELPCQQLP